MSDPCLCGQLNPKPSEHFVQFYDEDASLVQAVSQFLGAGLGSGHAGIIIATDAHRAAIATQLQEQGLDLSLLEARSRYFSYDAAEMLRRCTRRGRPDPELFKQAMRELLAKSVAGRYGPRVFGEMVALLSQDGSYNSAIELEHLWCEVAQEHRFSLFCAYPASAVSESKDPYAYAHICEAHSAVISAESPPWLARQPGDSSRAPFAQQGAAAVGIAAQFRTDADGIQAKRAEELLDAQKVTLEMLVRGAPLSEVLTSLAQIVEQQSQGHAVASILLLDDDSQLHNGASPSLPESYLQAIDGIKANADLGTCASAAATRKCVITPDIEADPKWQTIKHLPLGLGFQAAWSLPILAKDGHVLGTFGTYFRERREPSVFERQVVEILARTAALAIEGKSADEALRRSEAQFRLVAEALPQIVWTARPDGYLDYFNKRWHEFTGFEAVYGDEGWRRILHPEDVQRTLDCWYASVRSGQPYQIEYRFKDRQVGNYRWFLGRALPICDDSGTVIRWFGTCTDIDDQKRAAEKLEKAVVERTASLREAIAQMEEFSYTVSHDLRAPLRGMHAYTQALLEDFGPALPTQAEDYLKRIASNATRLDKMILDVLTFSRVTRAELHMEVVALDKLIRQIVEQYPAMQKPYAQIVIEPLDDVFGHEPSLTQALSNLLNNAIKFVPPDVRPRVRVWSERRNGTVRLWIEDNGIGVSPKYQHRLFNMFERIHPELKHEGTGVGLAIVRKAVERMGGRVGIDSDGVNGSRFWIEVRAADVPALRVS